jgi:hypothetical protein
MKTRKKYVNFVSTTSERVHKLTLILKLTCILSVSILNWATGTFFILSRTFCFLKDRILNMGKKHWCRSKGKVNFQRMFGFIYMSSAGDQSKICNIHAASNKYGCPYKSSSLPSDVCFSAATNVKVVYWKPESWGNRVSPGKFSDSYKMESRLWSHDMMIVFHREEQRMWGMLSVTRVKTTSW